MNVLIVAFHYLPEPVGIGIYTGGAAQALVAGGHRVTVIAAKPSYPEWRIAENWKRPRWHVCDEGGVHVVRCPLYVPASPRALRRIAGQLSFVAAALLPALRAARRTRPDVVFAPVPPLLAGALAWLVARLYRARLWLHVQDFEVEAASATGAIGAGGALFRLARRCEAALLGAADRVSSISPAMCARALAKGVSAARVVEFRNWADIDRIVPLDRPSAYRAEWGLGQRTVVLYSGTIARKQGIELIVAAAKALQARDDVVFVICGDGAGLAELAAQAAGLDNLLIRPLQPVERLGELLSAADIFVLPQLAGIADLALPSKLANMLAAGRPVVATAAPGTGLAAEVEGVGLVTPPGDVAALAAAIASLADHPRKRAELGRAARTRALERWDRQALLARFLAGMRQLAGMP